MQEHNKANSYPEDKLNDQLQLEASFKEEAEERMRRTLQQHTTEDTNAHSPLGKKLVQHSPYYPAIYAACKALYTRKKAGAVPLYMPAIIECQAIFNSTELQDKLAHISACTGLTVLLDTLAGGKERPLSHLSIAVGKDLSMEVAQQRLANANPQAVHRAVTGIAKRVSKHTKMTYFTHLLQHVELPKTTWTPATTAAIGGAIIDIILDKTPYFYVETRAVKKGKWLDHVAATPVLLKMWQQGTDKMVEHAHRFIPTIIPPAPWTCTTQGGYYGDLRKYTKLIRLAHTSGIFTAQYLRNLDQLDMQRIFDVINAIQNTPWRISSDMLDILRGILEDGGDIASIPRLEPLPAMPLLPDGHTEEELARYKQRRYAHAANERERRGRACRLLGIYRAAERFAGFDKIYFPHNLDFRGRIYPVSTLSPQGDEITKSLLRLVDVPPCKDESDKQLFYIEGANRAGVDKVSMQERVAWVEDNHNHIMASAANPREYLWWSEQDEPWQMLSWCLEYRKLQQYLKDNSGSIIGWQCGIAISYDGSCSGLQHFSAVLRDSIGGAAVNLIPADKPQDIYKVVAAKVQLSVEQDAKDGTLDTTATFENKDGTTVTKDKLGTKTLAQQWLAHGITRKVTKRAVMTLPYGSRTYGFAEQLLEDIVYPDFNSGISVFTSPKQAAQYMAKHIWEAVQTTVVKAVEGMDWLKKCADIVCKQDKVVQWQTPFGLRVQQHYMGYTTQTITLRFQGMKKRIYLQEDTGHIDTKAQVSGIAPNAIHSMDASHLMWTVQTAVEKYGVQHFALIHDSYGTSLGQAAALSKAVREAFVEMYTTHDAFHELYRWFSLQCPEGTLLPQPPAKGELQLEQVLDSLYAFA